MSRVIDWQSNASLAREENRESKLSEFILRELSI